MAAVYEFTGDASTTELSVDEQRQLIYAAAAPGPDWTAIAAESSPAISTVTPDEALIGGDDPDAPGTPLRVSLSGTYFLNTATVTIGGNAAAGVVVKNQNNITCFVPAHAIGAVDIIVTNPNTGSSVTRTGTLASSFNYVRPYPVVTSVFATSTGNSEGTTAGGTAVTVMGSNFATGAEVTFGDSEEPATSVVVVNDQQITCVTPEYSATPVDVTVTVPNA
jgi:hypothetical protein